MTTHGENRDLSSPGFPMVHGAVLLYTRGPDGLADACAPERPVCAVDLRREGIHNERNPSTGRRRGGGDLQVAGRWPQYPTGTREGARRQRPPRWHTLGGAAPSLKSLPKRASSSC